jgi:hypothetical protein
MYQITRHTAAATTSSLGAASSTGWVGPVVLVGAAAALAWVGFAARDHRFTRGRSARRR